MLDVLLEEVLLEDVLLDDVVVLLVLLLVEVVPVVPTASCGNCHGENGAPRFHDQKKRCCHGNFVSTNIRCAIHQLNMRRWPTIVGIQHVFFAIVSVLQK